MDRAIWLKPADATASTQCGTASALDEHAPVRHGIEANAQTLACYATVRQAEGLASLWRF